MNTDRKHTKLLAAGVWLAVLIGVLLWGWHNEQSTGRVLLAIFHFLTQNPLAAGLYIALYALRTFIFFPAMVLTIGAGSLFGFWMGALVALVGENLSASLAYAIARFFGSRSQTDRQAVSKLTPFRRALHKHAFPAVLTLRATYLPFDPVNYGCGLLRVRWWPYFTGSLIGMLPPMLTFVSFGASVEFSALAEDLDHFHPLTLLDASQLAVSAVLLLLSAVIVVFAERHRRHLQGDSGEED